MRSLCSAPCPRRRGARRASLAGLALTALLWSACSGPAAPVRMEPGAELPEFTLTSLEGVDVSSSGFADDGLPTIVNFWATWCQPCRKEMPELQSMAQDPNLKVVGIALDEEGAAAVRPFVDSHGITYPILLGNQEIFQRLGGFAIPYTLVLDPDGKLINLYRGPATEAEVRQDLASLGPAQHIEVAGDVADSKNADLGAESL